MRSIKSMKWTAIAVALFVLPVAQQPADDALKAQLLASPPATVLDLAKRVSPRDHRVPIDVQFLRADLDATGKFQYVVAFFFTAETSQDGFLRIFKQTPSGLKAAGDEDSTNASGGNFVRLELIDVNDDGIPEIMVTGSGLSGAHSSFDLFLWTGSSLHCMTNDVDTTDGYLADVDGDGQLEIIAPPYTDVNNLDSNQPFTGFRIYKVEGSGYKFEKDSILDPTGRHDASGNFAVVDFETRTEPNRFSLEQVRDAGKSDDEEADGVVHVDIRQLRAPDNKPVNVDQIDPSTIVLDRNTRPLRVRHLHGESDDDDRKKNGGSLLRGEFSRQAVLRRLARQDLTKPLAPGDKVGISVRAKLKNGRTAGGTVHVTISRDNDHDDRSHE